MLPLRVRVNLGAMPMKGYTPKLQYYWNFIIKLFSVISRTLVGIGSYPSAEKQSVCSTASTDWVMRRGLWQDKSWLLHHDTAPAYKALNTRQFLTEKNISFLKQPPCSPEFALRNSFLSQAQMDHPGNLF